MILANTTGGYTAVEVWSIAGSVASVLLAVVAVGLTLALYALSNRTAQSTERAMGSINSNVAKLEEFFRTFHAETFQGWREDTSRMMDLFQAGGVSAEAAKKRQEELDTQKAEIKAELQNQLDASLAELKADQTETAELRDRVGELVGQAVDKTRQAQAAALLDLDPRMVALVLWPLRSGPMNLIFWEKAAQGLLRGPGPGRRYDLSATEVASALLHANYIEVYSGGKALNVRLTEKGMRLPTPQAE